jgi:hypothetical protein
LQLSRRRRDPALDDGLQTIIGVVTLDDNPCWEVDPPRELWDNTARVALPHLERAGVDESGWEALFVCPLSGRFWLEDYPRSAEQGGGPMRLRVISDYPSWWSRRKEQ